MYSVGGCVSWVLLPVARSMRHSVHVKRKKLAFVLAGCSWTTTELPSGAHTTEPNARRGSFTRRCGFHDGGPVTTNRLPWAARRSPPAVTTSVRKSHQVR